MRIKRICNRRATLSDEGKQKLPFLLLSHIAYVTFSRRFLMTDRTYGSAIPWEESRGRTTSDGDKSVPSFVQRVYSCKEDVKKVRRFIWEPRRWHEKFLFNAGRRGREEKSFLSVLVRKGCRKFLHGVRTKRSWKVPYQRWYEANVKSSLLEFVRSQSKELSKQARGCCSVYFFTYRQWVPRRILHK